MDELSKLVSIFEEGLTTLAEEVGALETSRTIGREIFAACLLCRIITNLTGLQLLHRQGLSIEAATLLRSCLETTFWLGAIAHDPAFIDKIVKQDNQSRKSLAKHLLKHPMHVSKLDDETIKALRTRGENKAPEGGLACLEIEEVAEAAGLKVFYPIYLNYSNQSAHPSAASLQKHVQFDDAGEVVCIECAPRNDDEWIVVVSDACALIFHSWFFLNEVFPRPERDWPEKLWARYSTVVKAMPE